MSVKRAICVGINDYVGSPLRGCVNDAKDWGALLRSRGFTVTTLLNAAAKKAAIVRQVSSAVSQCVSGDWLVVTFSGHGTHIPDLSGDESDRRDEAFVPFDGNAGQLIVDDEVSKLFATIKPGVKCVLVADSCHSGTVTRFAEVGTGTRRVRYLPYRHLKGLKTTKRRAAGIGIKPTTALLLAGCREMEYSFDAEYARRPNGAFTYVALTTLKKLKKGATFADWYVAIRRLLPSVEYAQTPQFLGISSQHSWTIFD